MERALSIYIELQVHPASNHLFEGPGSVLAFAGIRRLVVHIKEIEQDDLILCQSASSCRSSRVRRRECLSLCVRVCVRERERECVCV